MPLYSRSKAAVLLASAAVLLLSCSRNPETPMAGMGIMIGEVTTDTAIGQVRLTLVDELTENDVPGVPGFVEFSLTPIVDGKSDPAKTINLVAQAMPENDFIARACWSNLSPGTQYRCETRI